MTKTTKTLDDNGLADLMQACSCLTANTLQVIYISQFQPCITSMRRLSCHQEMLEELLYIPYITFNNTKAVDSRGIYGFYKEGQQGQFSATHLQVGHKTCPCRP